MLKFLLLSVSLAASSALAAACQPGEMPRNLTRYGREVEPLVESFLPRPAADGIQENGWPQLIEALESLKQLAPGGDIQVLLGTDSDVAAVSDGTAPPGSDEWARTAQLVARAAELGVFEGLKPLPGSYRAVRPAQEGDLIAWILPELGLARRMAVLNVARFRIAAHEQRADEAIRSFEETLAMGRIASHQFTLIDHLVALSLMNRALEELARQVVEGEWNGKECREFLACIDRQRLAPLEIAARGERLMGLDCNRFVYEDPAESPSGQLAKLAGREPARVAIAGIATKEQSAAYLEGLYHRLLELARMPMWHALHELPRVRQDMEEVPSSQIVAGLVTPAVTRVITHRAQTEAWIAGVGAMLALEAFRGAEGRYPDKLEVLIPDYLAELPLDPFTGEPLRYRRLDAEPSARQYLIYSVGWDLTDDGGLEHESAHGAATPSGMGFDIVFNRRLVTAAAPTEGRK